MTRTMFFAAGIALSASLAASTVVFADMPYVNEIDVEAEIEDAANSNALKFWPDIEADMETAIEARAAAFRADHGYDIKVRLKEISMTGTRVLTGDGEFNHMEGWVYFRAPGDPTPVHQKHIVLDASTLSVGVDEEGLVLPELPLFYTALLDSFALSTMEELATLDPLPNSRLTNRENDS